MIKREQIRSYNVNIISPFLYKLLLVLVINFRMHIIKCDNNAQEKRVMIDFAWVESKKPRWKKEAGSLAKHDPCSVWRAPGRLGIGLIVINITSSYRMSVIIYTCFTELNRSCARPPRVGTRFGFILARYHPRLSVLLPFFTSSDEANRRHHTVRVFVFAF